MARKKEPPKPLLATKHDFVDSLDNVVQRSITLLSAIETVLSHGKLPDGVAQILKEHSDAFRKSVFNED